jgi:electron transfer flavoprotein alpha/beta subunit
MQDERSVVVLLREVQDVLPPVLRNEPDLRKILFTSAHFETPDGDAIELFVLPATQAVAFKITPVNSGPEQAEVVLRKAVAHGVFDELILAMKVLKWLKPLILQIADHAAQREAKYLELRLQSGEVQCGGECACK